MKKLLIILICISFFIGCETVTNEPRDSIKLKATISNTNESISLGDTLKIRLVLPDTITTESYNRVAVNSVQKAQFITTILRLDTMPKNPVYLYPPEYFASEGSISFDRQFNLVTTVRPFAVTINIVPTQKGLYNLAVNPQPQELKINDRSFDLITDFDVINSHFMLINPYYPEIVADSLRTKQDGYGYYWFRVN